MNANPFDLQAELKNLPAKAGVYRMYDAEDTLIYIGKAKLLKNRVRSYFQTQANHSPKTRAMVAQIHHFNYIVTNTEVEALILEDSLIKQFKPRYNILLRDDRRFPWIGLTNEAYPRLTAGYVMSLLQLAVATLASNAGYMDEGDLTELSHLRHTVEGDFGADVACAGLGGDAEMQGVTAVFLVDRIHR